MGDQKKALHELENAIDKAIKKVGGSKENDLCKFIPVTSGGYMHHFTLKKMKVKDPSELSSLIEKFEKEGNQKVVELIAGLSPVAWRHIQLAGNYTFGQKKDNIVLERLLENLAPLGEEEMLEMVA